MGVRIIAPFVLEKGDHSFLCIGFLPDFGAPEGMVMAPMDLPEIPPNRILQKIATEKGFFISFINASVFGENHLADATFTEALQGWGYFGDSRDRRSWL